MIINILNLIERKINIKKLPDVATVGVEDEGMNFDTEGGDVLLLELSGRVTFDEGRLAGPSIADEDQLEGGHVLLGFGHLDSKSLSEGLSGVSSEL
jgi:hypothetical protein